MRNFMRYTGLFSFALFLTVLVAQNAMAETKIGFVNQSKLLEKAPQAEAARNKIQKEFAKRDKDLVALQDKIKAQATKLQKDGSILSETELNKLKRDITSMKRDLDRDKDAFKQDLAIRQNEELLKLQKDVVQAIMNVAESQKYDLIVSDGVVFASNSVDITDKILDELKKIYKQ